MSIVEEVLLEEYERSVRISRALKKENSTLPKGSIQRKRIAALNVDLIGVQTNFPECNDQKSFFPSFFVTPLSDCLTKC